jgi:hypothetical protein
MIRIRRCSAVRRVAGASVSKQAGLEDLLEPAPTIRSARDGWLPDVSWIAPRLREGAIVASARPGRIAATQAASSVGSRPAIAPNIARRRSVVNAIKRAVADIRDRDYWPRYSDTHATVSAQIGRRLSHFVEDVAECGWIKWREPAPFESDSSDTSTDGRVFGLPRAYLRLSGRRARPRRPQTGRGRALRGSLRGGRAMTCPG